MEPKFKRVLLKLSGEALMEGFEGKSRTDGIIDFDFLDTVCKRIRTIIEGGTQVAIVVGGGNIWRGAQKPEFDRVRADYMGMMATAINSIGIQDALIQNGVPATVMTALDIARATEPFNRFRAIELLEAGHVVIFGAGLGTPFFSTDTTAVVRAAEIGADMVLFAKNIDSVYDKDPRKFPDAVKLDTVTYARILADNLGVIDSTAAAFAQGRGISIKMFGLSDPDNIIRAAQGEDIGTFVYAD